MRAFTIVAIASLALATEACAGGAIHGLDTDQWFELLASGGPLPIASGDDIDFDALSRLGPGATLFLAMHAAEGPDEALVRAMLREAIGREKGRYRKRAVELLSENLLSSGDGPGLVSLCRSEAGAELTPYRRAFLEASGLAASGSYAEALAAVESLRASFPAEAAKDAAELAATAFASGYRAGRGRWANEFSSLVAMDGSPKVYESLSIAVAAIESSGRDDMVQAIRAVGPRAFLIAEARSLYGARQFGAAIAAFRRYSSDLETPETIAARISDGVFSSPEPLTPDSASDLFLNLPRAAASDAAKSFMAASRDEGEAGFLHSIRTVRNRSADPSGDYFDAFWYGRFLRAGERWPDAERWFKTAAGYAADSFERDAAGWYAVEAAWKRSGKETIAALGEALAASRNPGYYSDLIEPISREALVARDGAALAALDAAVRQKASARDAARLAYLCARAAQVGIISDAHILAAFGSGFAGAADYAEARLRYAYGQRADEWYRLAAAYRLGEPLVEPLAPEPPETAAVGGPASGKPAAAPPSPSGDAGEVSPDGYATALARFGLGARIRKELGPEFSAVSEGTVRLAAAALGEAGRHDQAYRLIATQFWKSGFVPTRLDAELYWPRPYRESFSEAARSTGLDESLLYGLARSESAFDPGAVSKSGAIGLTQLMPATAAEMAGRLRIKEYDLADPDDNVAIGSAYFARVLGAVDGRVLPAVFSYNGGPTRFRRWEAEYGKLPLDLLLEALSYAETRQYGRNVASAALQYAALYGERDLRDYFAYLIGEGPRPD